MAIKKGFSGSTIYKPGAFSRFAVDNSAGSDIGTNDVLFLIGESDKGAPGDISGILEFSASRLKSLVDFYGTGPLVDCAVAAVRPSVSPGVNGVGKILVWKTNSSLQAEVDLLKSAVDMYKVKGRAYGAGDNNFSIVVAAGTSGSQKQITITELGGTTETLGENANQTILNIQYTGDGSAATYTIAGATRNALTLTTALTAQSDGSVNLNIALNSVTMKQLADSINASPGYTASLVTTTKAVTTATELDVATAVDIKTASVLLKRLQLEVLDVINTSDRVIATEFATILGGVPDNITAPLAGGAQGASLPADFTAGFSNSLTEEYSVLLPAVSRDASVDIADAVLGFTDASSTYIIADVLAAAAAHLSVRGSVQNRKEAQGMGGIRIVTKAAAFTAIALLNDKNMQVTMQDVLFLDATGTTKVGQPHILAALMAGIRLGTDIGEPMTNKFIRASGIGHFIDPATGISTGDFKPALDADDAIINGVTFVEKRGSGFRVVIDNTTYGIDASFLFNRGSVIEAVYFVNKTLRDLAEDVFIGKKVSNGIAAAIKAAIRNKLRELNQPDVQIITSSDDAPEGFREDTFVVEIVGNTATVTVEYKPVQGLDFVFYNFTIGDITQTA